MVGSGVRGFWHKLHLTFSGNRIVLRVMPNPAAKSAHVNNDSFLTTIIWMTRPAHQSPGTPDDFPKSGDTGYVKCSLWQLQITVAAWIWVLTKKPYHQSPCYCWQRQSLLKIPGRSKHKPSGNEASFQTNSSNLPAAWFRPQQKQPPYKVN